MHFVSTPLLSRRVAALALGGLVLLGPGSRNVAASSPGIRVMLSQAGLGLLTTEVARRLNGQHRLPDISRTLIDGCGSLFGQDSRVTISQLIVNLNISSLTVLPLDDKLRVQFYLALQGRGKLAGRSLACIAGDVDCEVTLSVSSVPVVLDIVPAVSGGAISVSKVEVKAEIGRHNLQVNVSSCGSIGQMINELYAMFEDSITKMVREKLDALAKDQVATALTDALSSIGDFSGDAGFLTYAARPSAVATGSGGIGVDVDVAVSAKQQSTCAAAGSPEPAPATQPPTLAFQGEHLGLAFSKTLLYQVMVEVWRSGLFCLGEMDTDSLGALRLRTPNPPQVMLQPASDARLIALFPGVELDLDAGKTRATMDLMVGLRLDVDNSSAVLLADPLVEVGNIQVQSESDGLLDYAVLLPDLVPSLAADIVRDMVLFPRVVLRGFGDEQSEFYLYIARAQTTAEHIMMFAKLHRRNAADKIPPTTHFVEQPEAWAKKKVAFVVSGTDDSTPEPLLRYRWRLDGGQWSEPHDSPRREFELPAGEHTVEAAAVDLSGNSDDKPVGVTFTVDSEAPKLKLVDGPPDPVTEPHFSVTLSAEDDATPAEQIRLRVRLERQADEGDDDSANELQKVFRGETTISLPVLGRGIHTITIFAEDAAGNRSVPVQALFESEADAPAPAASDDEVVYTSGCSTRPPSELSAISCTLVLLAAAWLLRRRKGRVA